MNNINEIELIDTLYLLSSINRSLKPKCDLCLKVFGFEKGGNEDIKKVNKFRKEISLKNKLVSIAMNTKHDLNRKAIVALNYFHGQKYACINDFPHSTFWFIGD